MFDSLFIRMLEHRQEVRDRSTSHAPGWRYSILPFLEEQSTYDMFADVAKYRRDWRNTDVARQPSIIPSYVCPSVPNSPRAAILRIQWMEGSGPDAFGVAENAAIYSFQLGEWFRGAWFPPHRRRRRDFEYVYDVDVFDGAEIRMIQDGLSKTVLIVETAKDRVFAQPWMNVWAIHTPTGLPTPVATGPMQNPPSHGLSSYHQNGAHVSMCDGSIRFLDRETDVAALAELYSRDRNEASIPPSEIAPLRLSQ